jgi:hypothetical protein
MQERRVGVVIFADQLQVRAYGVDLIQRVEQNNSSAVNRRSGPYIVVVGADIIDCQTASPKRDDMRPDLDDMV